MKLIDSGKRAKNGQTIYNLPGWKYGFSTVIKLDGRSAIVKYVTKYITKDPVAHMREKHRYYASRNLNRAEPGYHIVDEEDFLKVYGNSITYSKSVTIPEAYQQVNYYELKY